MKTRTPIRAMRVTESRFTYVPHLIAVACLWLLAMSMDYADATAHAEAQAQDMSRQMASCLRGEWHGTAADGVQIRCYQAETFDPATETSSTPPGALPAGKQ